LPAYKQTALLIALHHAFIVDHQRSIEFATLAANPSGVSSGFARGQLARFLKEAVHAGLPRQVHRRGSLEQITTCLTLAELLERRVEIIESEL
jgi:hypothetical protein